MSLFAGAGGKKLEQGSQIQRVKSVLEHIGLYVGLACYTAIGAKVFQELELPHEKQVLETQRKILLNKRDFFIWEVGNISLNSANHREVSDIYFDPQ